MNFSRRTILTGAAGCLALPLLQSRRSAQAQDQSSFPQRLVLFYNPNGTVRDDWFPQQGGETDFSLGPILEPLAGFRDSMTIFSGISSTVAQDIANNGGPHQRGIGSLFTGQMLLEGSFIDGCGQSAGWAAGPSIDQLVAQAIGTDTPFSSLELGIRANLNDVQGRISYAAAGSPLPPINNPRELYQRLFFRAEPLDPDNPDSRAQSVLDTVKDQFRLLDSELASADREKLGRHLALVEDLERRMELTTDPSCEAPAQPGEMDEDSELTMPEVSRTHLDLLATAFACDLTRVASVQYSTGFNRILYPWIDDRGEGHSLSHSGPSDLESQAALSARATWHAGEIAYFLEQLASIPEGEGSVLDNTAILWGNEVSEGNSHSHNHMPYLLLGTAGGALRGGQHLTFDGKSNCDLLLAVLHAYGVELEQFGHPDHCSGVLPSVLA